MKSIRTSFTRKIAVAVLALAASTGALGVTAGSAHAAYVGGGSTNLTGTGTIGGAGGNPITGTAYNPGTVLATASCDSNRITVTVHASAEAGYGSGQWVSYRYWVNNRATGWNSYSGYAAAQFAYTQLGTTSYPLVSFSSPYTPGIHQFWDVKVEVIRWNGSQWVSRWYQPIYKLQNGSYNSSYCLT